MNTPDKVIQIAMEEVGYLEKSKQAYQKNPDVIYEKTAGAGQDNITKYGKEMKDIYPAVMDFPAPWCDSWLDWCFYKAYGVSTAKSMIGGNFDDYTVNSCKMYEKHNALHKNPMMGDQVFFTKNGKPSGCYHTGLVYKVDDDYFYTIEGNTSNADAVVANGGGVAKKKYQRKKYEGKVLFGRPKYDNNLKSVDEIAHEVIAGKWGNGQARRANLMSAGYNYSIVMERVNQILKAKPKKEISDKPKYIWDFLLSKIGNPYGVAGLMGNLQAESGLNPQNLQNSQEKKLRMSDSQYTKAVDNGSYKNFATDKAGYGIAQWTSSGRKEALLKSKGTASIGDLDVQLNYLWKELSTAYKSVLECLKTAMSVRESSDVVLTKFERPKDQSEAVKSKRAAYGQQFFDKFNGGKA